MVFLWDPAYALSADPAVYEKMLRDCTISGAYDHLQRSIVGHDFHFEPKDGKDPKHRLMASVQEQLTKEMVGLSQSLYNLSRASFKGATWGFIEPDRKQITINGKTRWWTYVKRVRDVDKRRFRLSQANTPADTPDGGGSTQPLQTYDHAGVDRAGRTFNMADSASKWHWEFHRAWHWWQPLAMTAPADRFIQHVVDTSEAGLGYGYGQADELYFLFWAKQQILRFGLQGLERWGQGFLYAKIKALRDGFAKGQSQSGAIQQTLAAMRKWRGENLAVVDADTDLAMLDMPATANAQCLAWVQYLDGEITKRILSALRPTGSGTDTGSYSQAAKEEDSTDTCVHYLRAPLEETWSGSVGQYLIDHNAENFAELGLEGIPAARLRLKGKEQRDIEVMLKVFAFMQSAGLPLLKAEVYRILGLTMPNDEQGAEVINWPTPAADSAFDVDGTPRELAEPIGEGKSAVGDRLAA